MPEGGMDYYKWLLIVQLFFAVGITGFIHAIPEDALGVTGEVSAVSQSIDSSSLANNVQTAISRQSSLPVIDAGAILFYSGNILLDLILNFVFAIPQMIVLLIHLLAYFIGIESYMSTGVIAFTQIAFTVMYFIGIIELITQVRSRGLA